MEPFQLLWLEEPVPPENVAAMREVKRASPVPLCAGENLYLRWGFRDLLEQQAVDFIMPDIPKCGGLSECRKIANMAEVYYVPLAPHNVCGPLGTMASAHVCASIPNFLVLEWHWIDYPGWDELTLQDQPVIQNGHVVLTDKPGHRPGGQRRGRPDATCARARSTSASGPEPEQKTPGRLERTQDVTGWGRFPARRSGCCYWISVICDQTACQRPSRTS